MYSQSNLFTFGFKPNRKKTGQNEPHSYDDYLGRLKETMDSLGYRIRTDVPKDGNCFFHAVSDQLKRLGRGNKSHVVLRQEVVKFLGEIMLDEQDPIYPFVNQEYVKEMKKSGTWADHPVIQATARMLHCNIIIVTSISTEEPVTKIDGGGNWTGSAVMLLGHIGELHYMSLDYSPIPTEQMNVSDDFNADKGLEFSPIKPSGESPRLPEIGETPNQPVDITLPSLRIGNRSRSFVAKWFQKWQWLHYDSVNDAVFCHVCVKAVKEHKLASHNADKAFISTGYRNWKNATSAQKGFPKHEHSRCHQEAVQRLIKLPKTTKDVGELLSTVHLTNKLHNQKMLLKILSNARFLARQGLAFRGGFSKGTGEESDSNFQQLYKLRAEDYPEMLVWQDKKQNKYTSPIVQNEILKTMHNIILRELVPFILESMYYSILIDETTDISNREQVVFCIRWVDASFLSHEDFIGLYFADQINADVLVSIIKDVLLRLNIPLSKCRGQCYDGCSTMSGIRSGVAKQIKDTEPRAIYTHCYGHSLNLACCDTIKHCSVLKNVMNTAYEITKLIRKSPKRGTQFGKIRQSMTEGVIDMNTPNIRLFCQTRWTVKADAMLSILKNYDNLHELWEWSLENVTDSDIRARILGVQSYMQKFEFFFGLTLAEKIFRYCDILSKSLQNSSLSASEGQDLAGITVNTLLKMRTDDSFNKFWSETTVLCNSINVDFPKLPRRKRLPARYESGKANPEYASTVEDYFRRIYFEGMDLIISGIKERFNQTDYKLYSNCEQLLLKAANGISISNELHFITDFYKGDFDKHNLESNLSMFSTLLESNMTESTTLKTFHEVLNYWKSLSSSQKSLFYEVGKLFNLVLVMPATNAVSERSFSALRRIKTYLRSTMSQVRLNHCMFLHIHNDKTDALDLVKVANEFCVNNEHRFNIFGTFVAQ